VFLLQQTKPTCISPSNI